MLYPPPRKMTNGLPIFGALDASLRNLNTCNKLAFSQEGRTIHLDVLQWSGEPSARLGRWSKKHRRTGRTATGCERQS